MRAHAHVQAFDHAVEPEQAAVCQASASELDSSGLSVFATLMMLAFLVDQVSQLGCPLFQAAWSKWGTSYTSLKSCLATWINRLRP